MDEKKPYLTLVDSDRTTDSQHDEEFASLPFYGWDERPETLPLSQEEAATAIHLANGIVPRAAQLLKVPVFRLARLIKGSPRLQRILNESYELGLYYAVAVPLETLFDPTSDQRAREWASTKLLQSRLAQGHPLSPAPPATMQSSAQLTVNQPRKTITFRWRTDADDEPNDGS